MCVYARFLNAYKPSGKEQLSPFLLPVREYALLYFSCVSCSMSSLFQTRHHLTNVWGRLQLEQIENYSSSNVHNTCHSIESFDWELMPIVPFFTGDKSQVLVGFFVQSEWGFSGTMSIE